MVHLRRFPVDKVLFFIDGFSNPNAGTEGQLIQLINGIVEAKGEPCLLSLTASEYMLSGALPCPVEQVGSRKISSPFLWWRIWRHARSYRKKGYRLTHCFFNDAALLGPLIFKLAGFKIVTSRRDMGIWYTSLNLIILRFNRFFTDSYVANSHAVKRHTMANEKLHSHSMSVIYNGYEFLDIPDRDPDHPFINANYVVLGIVANLRPIKRIGDAIRALSEVLLKCPNVRLVVVGNHDSRDPSDIFDLVNELDLQDKVFFAGRQDNIKSWLKTFDIALLCSESEGFSNAVIEYQNSGLPVVCSRVGGNPEIIEDGVNGFLYDKGNIQELANKVTRLVQSSSLRNSMGAAGKQLVQKRFSLKKMVDEYGILYQRVLSGSDR